MSGLGVRGSDSVPGGSFASPRPLPQAGLADLTFWNTGAGELSGFPRSSVLLEGRVTTILRTPSLCNLHHPPGSPSANSRRPRPLPLSVLGRLLWRRRRAPTSSQGHMRNGRMSRNTTVVTLCFLGVPRARAVCLGQGASPAVREGGGAAPAAGGPRGSGLHAFAFHLVPSAQRSPFHCSLWRLQT